MGDFPRVGPPSFVQKMGAYCIIFTKPEETGGQALIYCS
jgi:hypothetical protein